MSDETQQNNSPKPARSDSFASDRSFTPSYSETINQEINISSLSPEDLDDLIANLRQTKTTATNRRFWTKLSYGFNAFVDGMFDIVAPLGIMGAVAAAILGVGLAISLFTPPIGWAVLGAFLGIGAIFGSINAYKAVALKTQELDDDAKRFDETIERLEALKTKLTEEPTYGNYLDNRAKYYEAIVKQLPEEQQPTLRRKLKALYSKVKDAFDKGGFKSALTSLRNSKEEEEIATSTSFKAKPDPDEKSLFTVTYEAIHENIMKKLGISEADIDQSDAGSRHGRNAIMLGFFISQPIIVFAGALITWPIIVASAGLALIQIIPRYLERKFIDEPRNAEQARLRSIFRKTQPADDTGYTPLEKKALGIELELAATNIITESYTDTSISDVEQFDPEDGKDGIEMRSLEPSSLVASEIEGYRKTTEANAKSSMQLATGIAFANGVLHPIAWFAIIGLVITLAGGPIGLAFYLTAVAVGSVAAFVIAPMLAKRAAAKEKVAQEKQERAIHNYEQAAKECQQKINAIRNKNAAKATQAPNHKFDILFEHYCSKIPYGHPERDAKIGELNQKFQDFQRARQTKIEAIERKEQEFTKVFEGLNQTKAPDTDHWFTLQRGKRDFRDSVGLWEKPLTAASETINPITEMASLAGGVILSLGLGLITLIPTVIKKFKDNKRDEITLNCEKKAAYLEKSRRVYLSEKLTLESEISELERQFKQQAGNLVSAHVKKPTLFSHAQDPYYIQTPPGSAAHSAASSRSPSPQFMHPPSDDDMEDLTLSPAILPSLPGSPAASGVQTSFPTN